MYDVRTLKRKLREFIIKRDCYNKKIEEFQKMLEYEYEERRLNRLKIKNAKRC